jgi:hypothetical protein
MEIHTLNFEFTPLLVIAVVRWDRKLKIPALKLALTIFLLEKYNLAPKLRVGVDVGVGIDREPEDTHTYPHPHPPTPTPTSTHMVHEFNDLAFS